MGPLADLPAVDLDILTIGTLGEPIEVTNMSVQCVVLKSVNLCTESVRRSTGRRLNEN
jgi:hypothetical protein